MLIKFPLRERDKERERFPLHSKRELWTWNSEMFMNTFCISSLHNMHFKCTLYCILYLQCIQHMSCPISEQKLVINHALLLSFSILQSGTQFEQKKGFRGQVPQPTVSYLSWERLTPQGTWQVSMSIVENIKATLFAKVIQQLDPTVVGFFAFNQNAWKLR